MKFDLLVKNARVLTVDQQDRVVDGFVVHSGRIFSVGDVGDVRAKRELDLDGAVVIPGLIDAHNHMAWFGLGLSEIDLGPVQSVQEVYDLVEEQARNTQNGEFICGTGYYHERLGGHPDITELDRAARGHPVWLKHGSGHLAFVNTAMLKLSGLLDGSAQIPLGGRAVRDARGSFTGLLEERAQNLVVDLVSPYSVEKLSNALADASVIYAREGLTHVTEAGIGGGWIGKSPIELAAYARSVSDGRLKVRAQLMPTVDALHDLHAHPDDNTEFGLDLGICSGFGDERLRIGPMKIWVDGGLASRTAHVYEPFCDHGGHGYFQNDPEEMRRRLLQAHASGWRVAAHAIGDRAIDFVLDVIEEAQRAHPRPEVRHRIEHAAYVRAEQLTRMAALGITPVPQAHFIHDLGETMLAALGPDRSRTLYRHRSFLNAGLRVPGSSDRPVAAGSPLRGMQSMVQRLTDVGNCIGPEERVDPWTALRAYTIDAAWVAGEERELGSIEAGKRADFVVLADDPIAVDPSDIGSIEVLATYLGGRRSDRDEDVALETGRADARVTAGRSSHV